MADANNFDRDTSFRPWPAHEPFVMREHGNGVFSLTPATPTPFKPSAYEAEINRLDAMREPRQENKD